MSIEGETKTGEMIPYFFSKEPIPDITHPFLLDAIHEVEDAYQKHIHHSLPLAQDAAVQKAYEIITKKFQGRRFFTILFFWKAWQKDPHVLWNTPGFLHCTQVNYLLRILLVQSRAFQDSDIRLGYSLVFYISPHQYLKIRYSTGREIALDPWNHTFGSRIGTYARGFGCKALNAHSQRQA